MSIDFYAEQRLATSGLDNLVFNTNVLFETSFLFEIFLESSFFLKTLIEMLI